MAEAGERSRYSARVNRLLTALATEYAARWPFYNEPTRMKLGWEKARGDIQPILRAINEAGLDLVNAPTPRETGG